VSSYFRVIFEFCDSLKKRVKSFSFTLLERVKSYCVSSNRAATATLATWVPPPVGWTKVNFDGSFVEHTGEAGVGLIARNFKGEVVLTAWRSIARCASALKAEATSCTKSFQLAVQWIQVPWSLKRIVQECRCLDESWGSIGDQLHHYGSQRTRTVSW
jgi:hypothetical protein